MVRGGGRQCMHGHLVAGGLFHSDELGLGAGSGNQCWVFPAGRGMREREYTCWSHSRRLRPACSSAEGSAISRGFVMSKAGKLVPVVSRRDTHAFRAKQGRPRLGVKKHLPSSSTSWPGAGLYASRTQVLSEVNGFCHIPRSLMLDSDESVAETEVQEQIKSRRGHGLAASPTPGPVAQALRALSGRSEAIGPPLGRPPQAPPVPPVPAWYLIPAEAPL